MPRSTPEILAEIESFAPADDIWLGLDELLEEIAGDPRCSDETRLWASEFRQEEGS